MIVNNTKFFFQTIASSWSDFKAKYCPDGATCNDIATFGTLGFMIWFMYIAMEPIIRF
jgi:hypothetical protein